MGLEIVPGATWVTNARNGGSSYDPEGYGYPWRIVLHTVEGGVSAPSIAGHQYPPHLWYDPSDRRLFQTVPLNRGAFALYQSPSAPHYTNRARALQVELAGRAAEAADWPELWLARIAQDVIVPLVEFVRSVGGTVRLDYASVPEPGDIGGSARADAPQRFTPERWAAFNSVCGHRHVPMGDDHWDCGGLNMRKIASFAAGLLEPVPTPPAKPPTEEDDMRAWRIADGPSERTVVLIGGGHCLPLVYPASVRTWEDMHRALAEMAELGVISKHADGSLYRPITQTAVDVLMAAQRKVA